MISLLKTKLGQITFSIKHNTTQSNKIYRKLSIEPCAGYFDNGFGNRVSEKSAPFLT